MNDMRTVFCVLSLFFCETIFGQDVAVQLQKGITNLEKDPLFKHAIVSLYVVDSKTGKVIFDKNSEVGLAPASCQKVITSASAFELLGRDFTYKTIIGKDYQGDNKYSAGSLFIEGSGDPTLGSWRWKETTDTNIYSKILGILKKNQFTSFERNIYVYDLGYGFQPTPNGWIYEDMGNYYGAACFGFNWHENQFNLTLQSGEKEGYPTEIVEMKPFMFSVFNNNIRTGKKGSGDNAYIFSIPFSTAITTKGTIPLQEKPFTISGSIPSPGNVFAYELSNYLKSNNIKINGVANSQSDCVLHQLQLYKATHIIDSIFSPSLDSMNYWFLKKSINLYGEAFLKSIITSKYKYGFNGNYDTAISIVKQFWKQKGIEQSAINIIDGSGLSPANRVTTNALVTVMQYAKKQNWFSSFYYALPEMNGIKMKDGYIGGVRSYTGYIKSKSGTDYTFAFIVNNFDGSPATAREKMWKMLDILK
jgi:serine-type D-Ala-D-Ala carboxypeptidase/endopeptidase (penicillin-binding protein 4)